jgi:hypothetical protein
MYSKAVKLDRSQISDNRANTNKIESQPSDLARYTIWWERDEYRHVVDAVNVAGSEKLVWPEFVEHRRLEPQSIKIL